MQTLAVIAPGGLNIAGVDNRNFIVPRTPQIRHGQPRRVSIRAVAAPTKKQAEALEYRKLGDSDLVISEVTLGTMTWGNQNTEKEGQEQLAYAFDQGINILDTAEAYPIPMNKDTQGRTDRIIAGWLKSMPREKVVVATKVAGYSERSSYLRDSGETVRVDRKNIKESVEKSLKRLEVDHIDLLQIHWDNKDEKETEDDLKEEGADAPDEGNLKFPEAVDLEEEVKEQEEVAIYEIAMPDRYINMFGEYMYDSKKFRDSVPIEEQLQALQEVIQEGKVRYIGVSNETSFGVMEFLHAAKTLGLPKIVSIQNSYSLLSRIHFEVNLVEVCSQHAGNVGLLAYSPLAGGMLSGKYANPSSDAEKKWRFNLFPGFMDRYLTSMVPEAVEAYVQIAKRHDVTPSQLALAFCRDREFMTSTIIGATTMDQLKENISAFYLPRPLAQEIENDIAAVFKKVRDPSIY